MNAGICDSWAGREEDTIRYDILLTADIQDAPY